jgi:argininosuccinate synthase
MVKPEIKKVVLAYSGGLDTSVIVPWLRENYGCEVVCFTADVGQAEELDGLEEKALKSGASQLVIRDLREEFAEQYIFPVLKAGALYERKYMLGTSIARPLIAKHMVDVAHMEGADAIAHGCTGKGNDQVRFELTYMALEPKLQIISPWKDPAFEQRDRESAVEYAEKKGIPITASKKKIYSQDRNLWHISHEGGILENPWAEPEESMYVMSVSPEKAPDTPQYVEIEFENGNPIGVDGKKLSPVQVIVTLNKIGGAHGVGRVDLVENRLVGMKSRGVYETPGGTLLLTAHRELESLTLDKATLHYKDILAGKYAELVYNGQWFTPLRYAMDAFTDSVQTRVTGTVRLKLYKGNIIIAGRKSPFSLYREDLATFAEDAVYNQKEAEGFINLFGLPNKVEALLDLSGVRNTMYRERKYKK